MPTITSNRAQLETLAEVPCPIAGLEQQLELVKGELKSHDPATDEVRIELNDTNRPDLWSVEGIARQLRIKKRGKPDTYAFFGSREAAGEITADASVAAVRPFVGGFLADGVTVTDDVLRGLIETQEKLSENFGQRRRSLAIGIYPANAITFPVSYRAVRPDSVRFVPLGTDRELNLGEILAQHPKGLSYGKILSGVERYPVLVDAADAILSFPPIINSSTVGEVRVGDTTLFVEATGTDLSSVLLALNIFAVNMSDRGACIRPCMTQYPVANPTPLGSSIVVPYPLESRVTVERTEFERLLGVQWTTDEIAQKLHAYGCSTTTRGDTLEVTTPPYRFDYLHPVDAIEDCAISAGYNALAPEMPTGFTVGALTPLTHVENRVRDRLVGYGFEEVMTNVLTNREAEADRVSRPPAGLVEIANPMSEAYTVLRRSLIPSLLRVESASATSLYPHKLFEVGECAVADAGRVEGARTLSLAAGSIAHAAASFSELQSYVDRLFYDLGLEYRLEPAATSPFIGGRHARVVVSSTPIGEIGEIHPEVLTTWGIRTPMVAFEVDLTQVLRQVPPAPHCGPREH